MPRGVEDALIEVVLWGSETVRREGTRGLFEFSGAGLVGGEECSDSVETSELGLIGARSTEFSGALGALGGREAMANYRELSLLHGSFW